MKMPARPVASLPSGEPEWHVAKGTPEEAKSVDLAMTIYNSFEKKAEADFLGSISDTSVWADLSQPKDMSGKAEAKKFFQMFTKAFSDLKQTVDPIFAVDEYVVGVTTLTATHTGQLGPLKPTKKPLTLHSMDIMVVKDGKVQSGATYASNMELLGQEGLLPKPKAAKTDGDKKADGDKKPGGDKKAADKDKK
jgi:ketosteroid isomerase-like protein